MQIINHNFCTHEESRSLHVSTMAVALWVDVNNIHRWEEGKSSSKSSASLTHHYLRQFIMAKVDTFNVMSFTGHKVYAWRGEIGFGICEDQFLQMRQI
jgi:hypothetical protein